MPGGGARGVQLGPLNSKDLRGGLNTGDAQPAIDYGLE